jgi:hypothetical protein
MSRSVWMAGVLAVALAIGFSGEARSGSNDPVIFDDCDEIPGGCPDTCATELAACNGNLSTCTVELSACEAAASALPATGQDRTVDAGEDGNPAYGAALAYQDNGDGTITDLNTGLMWEKKSDDGSIHDWDTTYTWLNALGVFIPALNTAEFAGYDDWRLPNVKELQSIVNYGAVNPAVSAVFNTGCAAGCTVLTCSCTASSSHWSSTAYEAPSFAWFVVFADGGVLVADKTALFSVRAVRGGSLSQP